MKILVTAFEPFGGEVDNPTIEVVKALEQMGSVDTVILPVTFNCFNEVVKLVEENDYDYILHLGQAGGRNKITFEQIGINLMEATMADNNGFRPKGQPIIKEGEDGIFTTLPISPLVSTLQQKKFPVSISYTAGTYVCNYIMYSSLNYFKGTNTKVGFIHVPYSPSQVIYKNAPSMDTKIVVETLKESIRLLLAEDRFTAQHGSFGETH